MYEQFGKPTYYKSIFLIKMKTLKWRAIKNRNVHAPNFKNPVSRQTSLVNTIMAFCLPIKSNYDAMNFMQIVIVETVG